MPVITICGNIGSGKSTVIHRLNELGYAVHLEPVSQMEDLLSEYYNDMQKWAFHLQAKVLLLYNALKRHCTNHLDIVERSPFESKHIFAECLRQDGTLTTIEYNLYCEMYDALGWEPDVVIYLQADTKTCMKRILQRMRGCEVNISEEYIAKLNKLYEQVGLKRGVHVVDANQDIDSVVQQVQCVINSCT